jgi:CBS domain-containing protein
MVEDSVLYCTELIGLRVFDTRKRLLGRLKDAAVVPILDSSRVDRYLIGAGGAWLTVRYDQVESITLKGIHLRDENLTPYHSDEYMLRLVRDLLDQQIIDAHGRKVVRVNDVTMERSQRDGYEFLRVLEVDIGVRSIVRRLLQGAVPPSWIRRVQSGIDPNSIRWDYCNIVEPDPQRRLRLNISHRALEKLHPADLADIVEELSPEDRRAIIRSLDVEVAAEALSEMAPEIQASIVESLDTERAAAIIEEMPPEEAAHLLAELESETSTEILEEFDAETKTEVEEMGEYEEHTAGFLMRSEFVALPERATVEDAVAAMREHEDVLEHLQAIFLIDEQSRLVGAVPLGRLLLAPGGEPLRSYASEPVRCVPEDEHDRQVFELFDKYSMLTLPVVDSGRRLVGVIRADDIITVLRQR